MLCRPPALLPPMRPPSSSLSYRSIPALLLSLYGLSISCLESAACFGFSLSRHLSFQISFFLYFFLFFSFLFSCYFRSCAYTLFVDKNPTFTMFLLSSPLDGFRLFIEPVSRSLVLVSFTFSTSFSFLLFFKFVTWYTTAFFVFFVAKLPLFLVHTPKSLSLPARFHPTHPTLFVPVARCQPLFPGGRDYNKFDS